MAEEAAAATAAPQSDRFNELGVLVRREIEARLAAPLIDALSNEFDRERVQQIVAEVIIDLARQSGDSEAERVGGRGIADFMESLKAWTKGGALELDVLEQNDEILSFNVVRCRYAEMYRALGIPELGALLSCNRDFAMVEGFNPDIKLQRTQTIMKGAPFCDFRYRLATPETGDDQDQEAPER